MAKPSAIVFLSVDTLLDVAKRRLQHLQSYLSSIKLASRTDASKRTNEALRVTKHKNGFQYYLISEKGDTNGTYLPKNEIRKAQAIVQRNYNATLREVIEKQILQISHFAEIYRPDELINAYTELHPGRQVLAAPAILPQKEFVAQWLGKPYRGLPFDEDAPEFFTSSGVRVRSKSEVIIADTLTRMGVPFRYEQPLTIDTRRTSRSAPQFKRETTLVNPRNAITVHPDFTCLNPRTREEFIWEHFGLMSDLDYVHKTILKISQYVASGYTFGKNFIATFEDRETPLDIKQVQNYIEDFLL